MNETDILKKAKQYKWEKWLERPFNPFILSLFRDGITKKYYKRIGMSDLEMEMFLYEDGSWYWSEEVFEKMEKLLHSYLKKHNIFDITLGLEKFRKEKIKRIRILLKQQDPGKRKDLREVYEMLTTITSYIWLAHALEHFYNKKLKEIVPKYIKGDIDLFIGDASFPKKKNAHALMEEAILKGASSKKIADKFGWIRTRDGFSEPFSEKEIKKIKVKKYSIKKVIIPKQLKKIMAEVQELVYFRTQRTDVFYELLFLARPIIKAAANKHKLSFEKLKEYTVQSLINGTPERFECPFLCIGYKGGLYFFNKLLFKNNLNKKVTTIRGTIAQMGKITGIARVVKNVSELNKIKKGDILVTQMTFPSFITAMRTASAFVTDEGGITCHAAIVAREMRKPCIIGTKIATKVLKDGDLVEVDANKGIVKILNNEKD